MGSDFKENDFLKDMGKRISSKRKSLRLSQEELAFKSGVSTETISRAENGLRGIRPWNLLRIAKALDISTDYILSGERIGNDYLIIGEKLSLLTDHQYRGFEEITNSYVKMCFSENRSGSYTTKSTVSNDDDKK